MRVRQPPASSVFVLSSLRQPALHGLAGPRAIVCLGRTVITYRGCFRWSLLVLAAVAGLRAAASSR